VQEGPETSPFDWEEVGRYLKVISDSHFFAGSDKALNLIRQAVSPLAALDLALSFEKETMLFYYGITQVVRPKERGVVEEIIAQEQNHILCLSKLKDELKGGDLAEA
jgi:rubrerythrin